MNTAEGDKAQADKVSDQVNNAAEGKRGVVKSQAEKQACPDCDKQVSNLKRHQTENCRANPKNLVECKCKMMVLKRSMPEHLKGRFEKKTGRVLTQPCQGDQSKKLKCPTCGIIVKDLIRHTRERHRSTKLSETTGGKRPANSAPLGGSSDAKRQKEEMKTLAVNPLFQWSNADILQLTDDLLYKLQQERSRQDTGGIDREVMVRLGQLFMQRAFGVEVSRAPFLVDTDGNCLPNTLSYIRNPNQTAQMTAEAGTGLRQEVMENVIEFIKEASMEELEPIQVAAAGSTGDVGTVAWLTREELLAKLARYKNNGEWAECSMSVCMASLAQ